MQQRRLFSYWQGAQCSSAAFFLTGRRFESFCFFLFESRVEAGI
jgi:hypothetical protein